MQHLGDDLQLFVSLPDIMLGFFQHARYKFYTAVTDLQMNMPNKC